MRAMARVRSRRRTRRRAAARAGRARGREQAGVELPSVESRARVQSRQNACVTDAMTPISPRAVPVAPALGDLAAVVGIDRLERQLARRCARTISRGRHDVVHAPAVGRADVHELDEAQDVAACRGSGAPSATIVWSFTPRLTTMLILIGARPGGRGGVDALEHLARPGSRRRSSRGTPRRRASRGSP